LGLEGSNEVKNHPWFANFDWEALQTKRMPAPFPISPETHNWDPKHVNNSVWKDADKVEETVELLQRGTVQ